MQGSLQPSSATGYILIVDDDPNTVEMHARLVQSHMATARVLKARGGREALSLLAYDHADLILLDLIMPKMNGKEAFDEISKVRPEVKVIFSSGYAPETIRQKAALTDGANLVTKPVSPTELMRKVRNVLDGEQ